MHPNLLNVSVSITSWNNVQITGHVRVNVPDLSELHQPFGFF